MATKTKRAPTEYNLFVRQFALDNKGKYTGPELLRAAGAAWRAAGHVPAAKKSVSSCAGKKQPDCAAPCRWVNGLKRKYCTSSMVGAKGVKIPKAEGPLADFYADTCKGRVQTACYAPSCKWMGGKVNRCQRNIGAKALTMQTKGLSGTQLAVAKFKALRH